MNELVPLTKGILATTPFGSGIVTWWNDRKSQKLESDLVSFITWTVHHVNELHAKAGDKIDRDFLESPDFEELFIRLLESYMGARTDSKRALYKTVLVRMIRSTRPTDLLRDQYLHLLDQTSETEIEILGHVYRLQKNLAAESRSVLHEKGLPENAVVRVSTVSQSISVSAPEVLNILWSLNGRGLIYPLRNDLSVETPIVVTPFGANFCRFIMDD